MILKRPLIQTDRSPVTIVAVFFHLRRRKGVKGYISSRSNSLSPSSPLPRLEIIGYVVLFLHVSD